MNRIYTRTGDKGTTAIHGGERVPKTDIRIEVNGCIDELNVAIGILRTLLSPGYRWQNCLREIQINLMAIMSLVATRSEKRPSNPNQLPTDIIKYTEQLIDQVNGECSSPKSFILPGGTPSAAQMHQCRVLARKAERCLWLLNDQDEVPPPILCYLNRLSDLFFIMARWELQHSGTPEEIWRDFGYYRK